jgi:hypothetical protein
VFTPAAVIPVVVEIVGAKLVFASKVQEISKVCFIRVALQRQGHERIQDQEGRGGFPAGVVGQIARGKSAAFDCDFAASSRSISSFWSLVSNHQVK